MVKHDHARLNHLHSLMLITHFDDKVDYSHPIAVVKDSIQLVQGINIK